MYLNNPVIQSFGQPTPITPPPPMDTSITGPLPVGVSNPIPVYVPSTGVATVPFSQSALGLAMAADPVIKADMANMKTDMEQLSSLLQKSAGEIDYMLKSDEYTTTQMNGFSALSSAIMVIGRNYDVWRQQFVRRRALLASRLAPQQILPIS